MKKIEVELKFPLFNLEDLRKELTIPPSYEIGTEHQIDSYFTPTNPKRNFLSQETQYEWLRLRQSTTGTSLKRNTLNYKNFGENRSKDQIHCDERETEIDSPKVMQEILESLDFRIYMVVDKRRTNFRYDKSIISLDKVVNLGDFIEVEVDGNEFESIDKAEEYLNGLVNKIGANVGEQVFRGYPQLLQDLISPHNNL